MRIGVDTTVWTNPRGYGRQARGLLTALLETPSRHHFVFFIDQATCHNSRFPLPKGPEYVVIPTSVSPAEAASATSSRSLRDMYAISAALSRTSADESHPLDVLFYPSVFTYVPCLTRAVVLLGVHDVIAEEYPEFVFPRMGLIRHHLQRLMWATKGWLGRKQSDYIVTVSDYAKAGIIRQFDWPPERVWVVGEAPDPVFRPVNGRDTHRALANHGLDDNARFLVCLGGLNPHKNLGMLLEVLAQVREQSQFADVQLVLVGPAESDTFTPGAAGLRKRVEQLGLDEAVHITGYLPDEEVVHLLNAARALVMPSLAEGFGLGAVEASACGTPVIATKNSPLPELLEGGGLFFDPENPAELYDALTRLLSDDKKRARMGEKALARSAELTWPRAANQFLALLDTL